MTTRDATLRAAPQVAAAAALPRVADVVARPRVTGVVADLLERYPIVQVIAAAGAGKTTAVTQAVGSLSQPTAWIALEEWHTVGGRLCDDLVAGLSPIVPGLAGELDRARARGAGATELAAIAGSLAGLRQALLVIDDCHVVRESAEAIAVISTLARLGRPSLQLVLVGRSSLPLTGLGLDALDPAATLGDDVLLATPEEAEMILGRRHSPIEVDDALEATGGWIAGLVFEAWRASDHGSSHGDPLAEYLEREVRPRLGPSGEELLIASSIFDELDIGRAEALGAADARSWFAELRRAGVPAVWAADGSAVRLHPAIRERLRAELRAGHVPRRRSVACAAARALEREGERERAAELYLEAGAEDELRRMVPQLVPRLIERGDIDRAARYLTAVRFDPEPAAVVLARLVMASIRASGSEGSAIVDEVRGAGRLHQVIADEPAIGAFGGHFLSSVGRLDEAVEVVGAIPPGRAADVGRLALSLVRDDPEAPIPPFTGDVLDASIARLLTSRGRFTEVRAGRTVWADTTGALQIGMPGTGDSLSSLTSPLARVLVGFSRAIGMRDLATARGCVAALAREGRTAWQLLCEAELAIRLERSPARAGSAVGRLRAGGAAAAPFFRELADTWEGGALLLDDDPRSAARVLREAVASMKRGDRTLALATALVYLAEAEWRLSDERASDVATREAYETARRQGSLRSLMLALSDFPGVLSRHLDTEPADEGAWRSLGRALTVGGAVPPGSAATATAHLREFGDAVIVVGDQMVRPRITKSTQLLSYLIRAPGSRATRGDILNALWGGRDDETTRAYLRQAVRRLRDALPGTIAVTAEGDSLRLEGAITSESLEFDALLAQAVTELGAPRLNLILEALEVAGRGPFLPGSKGPGWAEDRRRQIAEAVAAAQLDAADLLLDGGQLVEALALLRTALDRNPLLERGWRLRMRAHGLLGDDDGVLAAYRACREALADLGLTPSSATAEIARTHRR